MRDQDGGKGIERVCHREAEGSSLRDLEKCCAHTGRIRGSAKSEDLEGMKEP